jgi:uncharacterized protein with LGFP repeats
MDAAEPGWTGQATVDTNLVGVSWRGDPAAEFAIEARTRDGAWMAVGELDRNEELPDDGSPDLASSRSTSRPNVSNPLWVGDASAIRVRVINGSVSDTTLEAVQAPSPGVPSGSAGALGISIPAGAGDDGYALTLMLVGVALAAGAMVPRAWLRSRRLGAVSVLALFVLAACTPVSADPPPPTEQPPPSGVVPPQPAITMRSEWGADLAWNASPDCAPGPVIADSLKIAVVHHSVNGNTYDPAESRNMVRAIWRYHVEVLDYCDIGYNFVVDRYGQIFEGRRGGIDKPVVAAHTGGFNTGSTGVALLGTYTSDQPPPAQWDALVDLLAWKLSVHKVDPSRGFTATSGGGGSRWPAGTVVSFPNAIVGHRDLWPTACPGDALYPRLPELRGAVQPGIGWPGGPIATPPSA